MCGRFYPPSQHSRGTIMTDINALTDSLVRQAKQSGTLGTLRFYKGYRSAAANIPVVGAAAAVEPIEEKKRVAFVSENIEIVDSELRIRLFAGTGLSGAELVDKARALVNSFRDNGDGYISDWKISRVYHDKNLSTFYRDIVFTLSYCEVS